MIRSAHIFSHSFGSTQSRASGAYFLSLFSLCSDAALVYTFVLNCIRKWVIISLHSFIYTQTFVYFKTTLDIVRQVFSFVNKIRLWFSMYIDNCLTLTLSGNSKASGFIPAKTHALNRHVRQREPKHHVCGKLLCCLPCLILHLPFDLQILPIFFFL